MKVYESDFSFENRLHELLFSHKNLSTVRDFFANFSILRLNSSRGHKQFTERLSLCIFE